MPTPGETGSRRFPWVLLLALLIGLSVILSECLVVYRNALIPARLQSVSVTKAGENIDDPVKKPETGPQYFLDFDGYYWVTFARQMVSEKTLRVRSTNLDNVPFGRPVHWSSIFAWWLVLLGGLHAFFSGMPVYSAVSSAAYYANPLLMALLLCGVGWAIYRRVGKAASFLLIMLLATQPALLRDFGYGRPDHHGLHLICALAIILLTVLGGGGWVLRDAGARKSRSKGQGAGADPGGGFVLGFAQARRWFVASAIMGGCGLWIGATQQSLIVASVGVGAIIATIAATRRPGNSVKTSTNQEDTDLRWAPELWRVWGRVGALTSLLAYLFEYFPDHLGMILEVNHPLYALAWLCAGEILYCIGKNRLAGVPFARYATAKLGLYLGGILVLPLLALMGPTDWYVLKDPLMLRVHSAIGEFQPLIHEGQDPWLLAKELTPWLLVFIAIVSLVRHRSHRMISAALLVGLAPSVLLGLAFLLQTRWEGLFVVATITLIPPLLMLAADGGLKSTRSKVGATLLLIAVGLQLVPNTFRVISRVGLTPAGSSFLPLADEVFAREVSLITAGDHGPGPVSVMTGMGLGSRIHFFGPTRAPGSAYWENLAGLRDMVDFFADYGEKEALRIAREREIDYIVVTTDITSMIHVLKYGNNDLEGARKTLAYRLMRPETGIPGWCRPVQLTGFRWEESCRIYRIVGHD